MSAAGQPREETDPTEKKNPDFDPTPILSMAPNITIRALQAADAEELRSHADNAIIASRMRDRYPYPYKLSDAQTWINSCSDPAATFAAPGPFDPATKSGTLPPIPTKYAICIDDKVMGGVGLDFHGDVECRTAELGYWIGEKYWYQGLGSLVVPAFVDWAWKTFDRLVRLEAGVFEGNLASCRVLEKCGMTRLQRKDKAVWKYGKFLALECFELLRSDT